MIHPGRWRIGLGLVLLATVVRLAWAVAVPTVVVGDFATYRESAIYLAEFGHFDRGFVYMPGLVLLLAAIHQLGGEVMAAKILGVGFGGLAAGPLYLIAARLTDNGRDGEPGQPTASTVDGPTDGPVDQSIDQPIGQSIGGGGPGPGAPVALLTGLAYALWPAGISLASVVGTDIPTAAMMLLALAFLCAWGQTRPLWASVAFGAAMGLAAYFRAVALPLTALSAGYWLIRRVGARATITRTALAIAVTVLMLLPWGLRNRRQSGEFYLTDSHGGITALMGNDPNTEGTYSRSLGIMFHDLTGRTFLTEPHRQTDRMAYALARQWITFDAAWTAGMIALRIERLFAPERGLLYWSVYRPGVLPPVTAGWFNQHRPAVTGLADFFYLLFVLGLAAGSVCAVVERRWISLLPVPFAVALAGMYALFVAEPRYRLTTEILLFPLAALGAVRLGASANRALGFLLALVARRVPAPRLVRFVDAPDIEMSIVERRGLLGTLLAVSAVALGAVIVVRGGASLREGHRWAATVWHVDEQAQLALWRPVQRDGGASPVRGTPPGALLTLSPTRPAVAAEITLPNLALPPGRFRIDATIAWRGDMAPGTRVAIGTASAAAGTTTARGSFQHAGGPVRLLARLERSPAVKSTASALITKVTLTSDGAP